MGDSLTSREAALGPARSGAQGKSAPVWHRLQTSSADQTQGHWPGWAGACIWAVSPFLSTLDCYYNPSLPPTPRITIYLNTGSGEFLVFLEVSRNQYPNQSASLPSPCLVGSESHRSAGLAHSACHHQLSLHATQQGQPPLGDGNCDL